MGIADIMTYQGKRLSPVPLGKNKIAMEKWHLSVNPILY